MGQCVNRHLFASLTTGFNVLSVNGKRGLNVHAYLWALLRFAVDSVAETPLWQDFWCESAPDHRNKPKAPFAHQKSARKLRKQALDGCGQDNSVDVRLRPQRRPR